MNRTEAHPVELAILLAVLVIEAAITLARTVLVPVVALVLTLASRRPTAAPEAPTPSSAAPDAPLARGGKMSSRPTTHPLALLATELQALPASTLRAMAGISSKRHTKAQLAGMLTACS
jgi:hypothetical protein